MPARKIEDWAGIISDDFTFEKFGAYIDKLRDYLIAAKLINQSLIISYDSRFLSEKFADTASALFERETKVYLTERDTPLPVITWEIKDKGAAGALMIGAGSAPARQSGLRFMAGRKKRSAGISGPGVERFEPRERYLKFLEGQFDADLFKKNKLKVIIDPMYGSGRSYLDVLLERFGCQVEEIHNYRDVLFGGAPPDPAKDNLGELKAKLIENKADLGLALNGDATVFAALDRSGEYFRSEEGIDALSGSLRYIEDKLKKG